jgi:hypothetical protein
MSGWNIQNPLLLNRKKFQQDLKALFNRVKEKIVVNPFKKTGPEMVTLDAGEIIDPEIV